MLQHELAPEQSALIIRDLLQPAFKRQVSLAGLFRTLAHRAFRLVLSLDSRPHGLRAMSQIFPHRLPGIILSDTARAQPVGLIRSG